MVSSEMIEKFKKLYLKKYNVVLNNEEATEMANGLVNLVYTLVKPNSHTVNDMHIEDNKEFQSVSDK